MAPCLAPSCGASKKSKEVVFFLLPPPPPSCPQAIIVCSEGGRRKKKPPFLSPSLCFCLFLSLSLHNDSILGGRGTGGRVQRASPQNLFSSSSSSSSSSTFCIERVSRQEKRITHRMREEIRLEMAVVQLFWPQEEIFEAPAPSKN